MVKITKKVIEIQFFISILFGVIGLNKKIIGNLRLIFRTWALSFFRLNI